MVIDLYWFTGEIIYKDYIFILKQNTMTLRDKIVALSWMEPEVWEEERGWKFIKIYVKAVLLRIFNPDLNEEDSLIVAEETEVSKLSGTEGGGDVRVKSRLRGIFSSTRDDRPMGAKKIVELLMNNLWHDKENKEDKPQ